MSKATKPNYQAWDIDEKDFPKNGTIEDKIRFLIGYGILAPSTHNTQPWITEINNDVLIVKQDNDKSLDVGDPDKLGMYISIGSFAENVIQAADFFGMSTSVKFLGSKVQIIFKEKNKQRKSQISPSDIKNRTSFKFAYDGKSLKKETIRKLESLSSSEVEIKIISTIDGIKSLSDIHSKAASSIAKNNSFAIELSNWLRPNNTKRMDGMPGFVVGNSRLKSSLGAKILAKKPELLQKMVKQDETLIQSSSAIVIFTLKNKPVINYESGVEAGRTIERLWLYATKFGLKLHPMFASIQDKKSHIYLNKITKSKGSPVFFMRIGYNNMELLHTPRKPQKMNIQSKLINGLQSHPSQHRMRIGKYDINYIVAGKGKPVVLLHGANIGWPQWYKNIDELAKHYKVYAPDFPGAGNSTVVNFSNTNFDEDYKDIMDGFIRKLGFKKVDIVGSSFGGWIAMKLASEQKSYINKLVVVNPIGFTKHMPAKFRPISFRPLAVMLSKSVLKPVRSNKNLEKFMRDVFADKNQELSNEFVDYFYELSKKSHNALFISRLAHFSGMRKELFIGEQLSQIKAPTLIIWGLKDPLMPYATVRENFKLISNSKIKLLKNSGHMPPVEAPTEFNKFVVDFLSGGENDNTRS